MESPGYMKPGGDKPIQLNEGRPTVTLQVTSLCDRPIQVPVFKQFLVNILKKIIVYNVC